MYWKSSVAWNRNDINLEALKSEYLRRLLPLYSEDRFVFKEFPGFDSMSKSVKSNLKSYVLDYTECQNRYLRVECKYYFQSKIVIQGVKLRTAGTLHIHLKHYFQFMNTFYPDVGSIFELDPEKLKEEYCKFYASQFGDPYSDVHAIDKNMNMKTYHHVQGEVGRILHMAESLTEFLSDDSEKFSFDSDIWDIRYSPFKDKIPAYRPRNLLSFTGITQPLIRRSAKHYIFHKLHIRSFATCQDYLKAIALLSEFLVKKHPETESLSELDRSIIEEFFQYTKEGNRFTSRTAGFRIGKLRDFLETCVLLNLPDKPVMKLILDSDYHTNKRPLPRFLTDGELLGINQHVNDLPITIARMLFTIETLGLRISELCTLRMDCLTSDENGEPVLTYYQHKTKKINRIPISDTLRICLERQMSDVRKQFGEHIEYLFPQNEKKPVSVETFQRQINLMLYKHKVLDRAGKPLRIQSHSFRATVATNYMNIGIDPNVVRMLIGQADIRSLKYYFETSQERVIDAYEPIIQAQEKLIRGIGDPGKLVSALNDHSSTSKHLCNGTCSKKGECEHFNACYDCAAFRPDKSLLPLYKRQLKEAEASAKFADKNGFTRIKEINISLCEQLQRIIKKCEDHHER